MVIKIGKKRINGLELFCFIALILIVAIMMTPILFAFISSASSIQEYNSAVLFPKPKNFFATLADNYSYVFNQKTDEYGGSLGRSMLITLSRIVFYCFINNLISCFGGYVFAKVRFKFKRTVFLLMLSTMMVPAVALMVPGFVWMCRFPLVGGNNILGQGGSGFINNPAVLYVPSWVSVYGIFLFRQCFVSTGNELAEASEIDGCGFLKTVILIYMPLAAPIIAVSVFNTFLGTWNDYMTSIIYMPNLPQWRLASTQAATLMDYFMNPLKEGGADYPKAFAIGIVMMLPSVVLFCFVQKKFIEGLSMGAVKG